MSVSQFGRKRQQREKLPFITGFGSSYDGVSQSWFLKKSVLCVVGHFVCVFSVCLCLPVYLYIFLKSKRVFTPASLIANNKYVCVLTVCAVFHRPVGERCSARAECCQKPCNVILSRRSRTRIIYA